MHVIYLKLNAFKLNQLDFVQFVITDHSLKRQKHQFGFSNSQCDHQGFIYITDSVRKENFHLMSNIKSAQIAEVLTEFSNCFKIFQLSQCIQG